MYYNDGVRKRLLLLPAVILLICFPLSSKASSYDLTIYKTADNSVMGVKEDKLGLDITGYMFIGEGNTEGLYFRIGVQTPFDTILGYLNLFNDDISKNESEDELDSKETENTISEKENFIDDGSFSVNTPPTLTDTLIPPLENTIDSPLVDMAGTGESTINQDNDFEIVEENTNLFDTLIKSDSLLDTDFDKDSSLEISEEQNGGEKNKEEINVGESNGTIDTKQGTVIKGSTTNNIFNKEWRLLFTFGPASRRFMGDSAIVYLGYGLSGDIGHKVELEKDTKFTINTSYAVLGADLDFGMRYNLRTHSSIRVGVHFTASLIGVKGQTILNTHEEEIDDNIDIYGYALSKRGIFETLSGKGYIMLATALGFRKSVIYNYSNTTNRIGGGTITLLQNV